MVLTSEKLCDRVWVVGGGGRKGGGRSEEIREDEEKHDPKNP
jgi:hypothetical protein